MDPSSRPSSPPSSRGASHGGPSAAPPFRAKGLVYSAARDFYAEHIRGGCDAVRAYLSPELAGFFDQQFLSGGWYDIMPILTISAAAARAATQPYSRIVRDNARWLAKRDLRGIYKVIVAVASIEMVVEKLPGLSLRYLDFGRAEGKMIGERVFESTRFGIPVPLADWFVFATNGFVPIALESAGAKNVHVRHSPHAADGLAHGVALVQTKFEISWE
jgi:hypothetical protein